MFSTGIFLYAASAIINGYAGGSLYARMGGLLFIVFDLLKPVCLI